MAELNVDILEAAYDDKLFDKELTVRQRLYLIESVKTAWDILLLVKAAGENGAIVASIAQTLQLHPNTVRMFLRWLAYSHGLIQCEHSRRHGGVLIYYMPREKSKLKQGGQD